MQCQLEGQQQWGWIAVPCDRVSSKGETLHEGGAGGIPQWENLYGAECWCTGATGVGPSHRIIERNEGVNGG
jgi:hypothetical protein